MYEVLFFPSVHVNLCGPFCSLQKDIPKSLTESELYSLYIICFLSSVMGTGNCPLKFNTDPMSQVFPTESLGIRSPVVPDPTDVLDRGSPQRVPPRHRPAHRCTLKHLSLRVGFTGLVGR